MAIEASYLLVRPGIGEDSTLYAVDVFARLIAGPRVVIINRTTV